MLRSGGRVSRRHRRRGQFLPGGRLGTLRDLLGLSQTGYTHAIGLVIPELAGKLT